MIGSKVEKLIRDMIESTVKDCERDAEQMRRDNNALNDQGVLVLVKSRLNEKFEKILESENEFHGA